MAQPSYCLCLFRATQICAWGCPLQGTQAPLPARPCLLALVQEVSDIPGSSMICGGNKLDVALAHHEIGRSCSGRPCLGGRGKGSGLHAGQWHASLALS